MVTSPRALQSFRRKAETIRDAHKRGVPTRVSFTVIELNSDLDDWYAHLGDTSGWPPRGTAFNLNGNSAHAYVPALLTRANLRVGVADVTLVPSGSVVYPHPVVYWIGILPVPAPIFGWTAEHLFHADLSRLSQAQPLPSQVANVRIENGEAVVETR
jgi:hypothetical protein